MNENFKLSAEKYYQNAKEDLEKKDLASFMENIGSAKVLSQTKELIAKVTFLKVKGLIDFHQHRKVLYCIDEALSFNEGYEAFRLEKYRGVALGYLGEFQKANDIFKNLISKTDDEILLVEAYNNIVWINLSMLRVEPAFDKALEEAKLYLDKTYINFDSLPDRKKRIICNNYSDYYAIKGEYDNAIKLLEDCIQYCEEHDLIQVYNNLAELYLMSDKLSVALKFRDYASKAERLAHKYNNNLEIGKSLYTQALADLQEDQLFTALDTLYLAFEHFKKAEAYPYAFNCFIKITQVTNECKIDRLASLGESLKNTFKETPFNSKV